MKERLGQNGVSMITIKSEQYLSELGKRESNQDNGGWDEGSIYVVCDGKGEHSFGEVASEIVAQTFINELHSNPESDIASIINRSENRISKFIEENPAGGGMSSTLALLHFLPNKARIAWVGNSRVYHFRSGKILFKTKDHSWANDAVSTEIINEHEAENHPKSNVITRAIQGAHKRITAEELVRKDVQKNDYFLLCSDGVFEAWTDSALESLFATVKNAEEALQALHEQCYLHSNDNYTAIVLQVEEVNNDVPREAGPSTESTPRGTRQAKGESASGFLSLLKRNAFLIGGLVVLIFGIMVYFFQRDSSHDTLPEFNTTNVNGKRIDFVEDDIEKIEKKAIEEEEEYTQETVDDRSDYEPTSRNARASNGSSNAGEGGPSEE